MSQEFGSDPKQNLKNVHKILNTVQLLMQLQIDAPEVEPRDFTQFVELEAWNQVLAFSAEQKVVFEELQKTIVRLAQETHARQQALGQLRDQLQGQGQGIKKADEAAPKSSAEKRGAINLEFLKTPSQSNLLKAEPKSIAFDLQTTEGRAQPSGAHSNLTITTGRTMSVARKASKTVPITHAILCTNYSITPKIVKSTGTIRSVNALSSTNFIPFNPHSSSTSSVIHTSIPSDYKTLEVEISPIYKINDVNHPTATKTRMFIKGWDLRLLGENGDLIMEIPLHWTHVSVPDPSKNTVFFIHTPKTTVSLCTETYEMREEVIQYLVDVTYEAQCIDQFDQVQGFSSWKKFGHLLLYERGSPLSSRVKFCIVTPGTIEIRPSPNEPMENEISLSSSTVSECSLSHMRNTFTLSAAGKIYDFTTLTRNDYLSWITEISNLSKTFQNQISSGKWTGYATIGQKKLLASKKNYWVVLDGGQLACYSDSRATDLSKTYLIYGATIQKDGTDKILVSFDAQSSIVITIPNEAVINTLYKALKTASADDGKSNSIDIRKGYLFVAHEQDTPVQKTGGLFWFVLSASHLSKYSGSKAHRPLISYDLKKLAISDKEKAEPYSFTLIHGQQNIVLISTDEKMTSAWVDDLKSAMNTKASTSSQPMTPKPTKVLNRQMTVHMIGGQRAALSANKKALSAPTVTNMEDALQEGANVESEGESDDDGLEEHAKASKTDADDTNEQTEKRHAYTTEDIPEASQENEYMKSLGFESNYRIQKTRIRMGPPRDNSPVVIDNGSAFTKIGFAHQEIPRSVIPSCISTKTIGDSYLVSVGYDAVAQAKAGSNILYPFEFGSDLNSDAIVDLYQYAYTNILHTESKKHPAILTTPRNLKFEDLRILFEIMFEGFEVPSLIVRKAGTLPFHDIGIDTGMVLDIGARTSVTCMWDGHLLQQSSTTYPLGGRQLDAYASKLLSEEIGYALPPSDQYSVPHRLKTGLCYVSPDYQKDLIKLRAKGFERYLSVPGLNQKLPIRTQSIRIPEVLFQPGLAGYDVMSVPQIVAESIRSCSVDLRTRIAQNIILCGGHTCFPGFVERLTEELKAFRDLPRIKIIDRKNKKFLPWNGAAMLSKAPGLQNVWLTADDYFEGNMDVVHSWALV